MFLHGGPSAPSPMYTSFPTIHTFLRRSCLSQNINNFNTLLEDCSDGPEEQETSSQQGPQTSTIPTWGSFP